jgi:hypothetical protein
LTGHGTYWSVVGRGICDLPYFESFELLVVRRAPGHVNSAKAQINAWELTNSHHLSWLGIYISPEYLETILSIKYTYLRPFSNRPLAIVDAIEVVSLETNSSENAIRIIVFIVMSGTYD